MAEHVDVLIVGAGLSGIGAACKLTTSHPNRKIAIVEAREASGGTWDLFRYPGIRSDSDMATFGFDWRPWPSDIALADGDLILNYLRTVASEYGVDEMIRYSHEVVSAEFERETGVWTVQLNTPEGEKVITANLLWGCTGYYDYESGYTPRFPGIENYQGTVVHPQLWPEDLDYTGKRVVVIGSGATAVTLVPSMANEVEHITMLQRTPTYILPLPQRDPLAKLLSRFPHRLAYPVVRWKNVLLMVGSYNAAQRLPGPFKKLIRSAAEKGLPGDFDIDTHFSPPYNPWDQRLCVIPDGDLFKALSSGSASMVTDTIDTFTETGIRLDSGEELAADIVITATGLNLKTFGGISMSVDGEKIEPNSTMAYKSLMLSGVPNYVFTIGYTNASWTLKSDLVGDFVGRLLAEMDSKGAKVVEAPREAEAARSERSMFDLDSGYVKRAADQLPGQGDEAPWKVTHNYLKDRKTLRKDAIDDGVLEFV